MSVTAGWHDEIEEWEPELIATRRDFHMHPEIGLEEVRTSGIVAERLRAIGFDDVRTGIAVTGVKAVLRGGKPGKTLLLRADMDALPIEEENEVEYRSQNAGTMHACGHDGHTAMLLATARAPAPPPRGDPRHDRLLLPARRGGARRRAADDRRRRPGGPAGGRRDRPPPLVTPSRSAR